MTISTCKPKMWLLSCILLFGCVLTQEEHQENRSTGLVTEPDDPLLLFSTLGGSFVGVGQRSGSIRWRQDNEPAVKVPRDVSQKMVPMFLPDPKDGSLYLYGAELEVLKKLPFTIPQLVASSPCRSSDGILYTGRKIDTWFSIDPTTGDREQLLGFNEAASTCPVETQDAIYVGRTEYNIIMVDSKRKERKWNITFYDYSAVKMAIEENDYDLVHFTTSSTGRVVTLDRRLGAVLWELDLGSPVIAVYSASTDGLVAVPFTGVAEGTLDSILQKFTLKPNDIQLYPTLYVGEHVHGLYALPSLVDSSTATISSASDQLMLEGPRILLQVDNLETSDEENLSFGTVEDDYDENSPQGNLIVLGHYKVPAEYKPQNQPLQITGRSDPVIHSERFGNISNRINIIVQSDDVLNGSVEVKTWRNSVRRIFDLSNWFYHREVSLYVMVLVIFCGLTAFAMWRLWARVRSIEQIAQSSRDNSRTNSNGTRDGDTVEPEPTGEGIVKVGKIAFNIEEVLGKGCEGTFVYKGEFDGRSVAVKRLLPDCFTFADREVALLRESDAHANVVRYFCTEQDRMFRYIALELAEATLQDYVLGKYNRQTISLKSILVQATAGLSHLHTLDIVHRDIKPHNVLLSVPGPRGEVRAMISDFGLCKKLQLGRMSFSRRSGVTGTDGWIAPEMLNGERTTCAVDIFSLGCVFYYVLSNGKHPFGDALRRQANILCDESDLSALHITGSDKELALILIRAMIDADPTRRPPALAVKNYPFFWDSPRILNFFQEVSDRVEKDDPDSVALMALEAGADRVVQTDWRSWIDIEVASDLRKYRSYRGESVRDLLRALRNKKHHYRELTPEAQASLGEIPEKFTDYWLSRFSHLLAHSWCAMQNFRNEAALRGYFHPDYEFTTYEAYSVIVNLPLVRPEQTLYPSNDVDDNKSLNHHWRLRNGIDWSPSRARFRPNKRKPERRRPERSVVWTLPSANVPAPVYSRYE